MGKRRKRRRDNAENVIVFMHMWGMAEAMLDRCIVAIFHHHNGRSVSTHSPATLVRKLEFVKTSFKEIPALRPYLDLALDVISRFKTLKDLRNSMAHGIPIFEKGRIRHFLTVKVDFGALTGDLHSIKPGGWSALTRKLAELYAQLLLLIVTLRPHDALLDETEEASGEAVMKFVTDLPISDQLRHILEKRIAPILKI